MKLKISWMGVRASQSSSVNDDLFLFKYGTCSQYKYNAPMSVPKGHWRTDYCTPPSPTDYSQSTSNNAIALTHLLGRISFSLSIHQTLAFQLVQGYTLFWNTVQISVRPSELLPDKRIMQMDKIVRWNQLLSITVIPRPHSSIYPTSSSLFKCTAYKCGLNVSVQGPLIHNRRHFWSAVSWRSKRTEIRRYGGQEKD